jgi:hypothetical protein
LPRCCPRLDQALTGPSQTAEMTCPKALQRNATVSNAGEAGASPTRSPTQKGQQLSFSPAFVRRGGSCPG